ncbi:hypothetical protein HXX76_007789 [Chlamydomonas incerta]|uniref:DUF4460 domain-containing protein n=1 Tax=Chlamydomonas incerta TaxID=51695 RepID=A0A835T9H6_CHLIN|nr:hypothetical protein HXX76_007789 [Chlamydomonas incerta]|eukprot:KAG2434061.1 hypothetical protein HXX76_007789 [Chlamydomonas incerta]
MVPRLALSALLGQARGQLQLQQGGPGAWVAFWARDSGSSTAGHAAAALPCESPADAASSCSSSSSSGAGGGPSGGVYTQTRMYHARASGISSSSSAKPAPDGCTGCPLGGHSLPAAQALPHRGLATGGGGRQPSSGAGSQSGRGSASAGGGGGSGGTAAAAAGSPDAKSLPLRSALRALYKRVHPDLFQDSAIAKAENERSLKLLHEYLALARGGDGRSPAARLPYRFVFYMREAPSAGPVAAEQQAAGSARPATPPLRPRAGETGPPPRSMRPGGGGAAAAPAPGARPPPSAPSAAPAGAAGTAAAAASGAGAGTGPTGKAGPGPGPGRGEASQGHVQGQPVEAGAGAAAEDDAAGLHKVELTLPPPAITAADSRTLAGPTRKALVKLLAACGLVTTGHDDAEGGEGGGGEDEGGPLSLAAFLPEAVEALRQAEASRPSDPAVRVANLRGALRLHHEVMASFADKQLAPALQVALLERLAKVVDAVARSARVRLGGCHIVIGDRLGLDRLGHLCLAAHEDDAAWRAFLTGVDLAFVAQRRKTVQAIRALESSVATAVGLAQVYTPYGNLTEPSYRTFLERLAALAAARGPAGGGGYKPLSLCVLPPEPQVQGQPHEPDFKLDGNMPGVVQASSAAEADAFYDWLEGRGTSDGGGGGGGGAALTALRARQHEDTGLSELTERVRNRLRLRSLTRDPRVAPAHYRRACGLMLEQAAALGALLEGATVRVGFANRLAPDGSAIEIAWNCEL